MSLPQFFFIALKPNIRDSLLCLVSIYINFAFVGYLFNFQYHAFRALKDDVFLSKIIIVLFLSSSPHL